MSQSEDDVSYVDLSVLPLWRGKPLRFKWRSSDPPPVPEVNFQARVDRRETVEWVTCGVVRSDIEWDDILRKWGAGFYSVHLRFNGDSVAGTVIRRDMSDRAAEFPTQPLPPREGRAKGRKGAVSTGLESPDPIIQTLGEIPDHDERLERLQHYRLVEREREMQQSFFKSAVEMLKVASPSSGGGNEQLVAFLNSDRDFWRNEAMRHQGEVQRLGAEVSKYHMDLMLARMGAPAAPGADLKTLVLKHGPAFLNALVQLFPGARPAIESAVEKIMAEEAGAGALAGTAALG